MQRTCTTGDLVAGNPCGAAPRSAADALVGFPWVCRKLIGTRPLAAVLTLLLVLTASAQQQPPAQEATGDVTFSSNTQLVIETVTVKDKSGKTIEGLTSKDFTLTEDGAPQAIKFFEYQKLPEIPEPLPPPTGDITVLKKFPQSRITAETPGSTRY
jgi:hypothetical protein